MAESSSDVDLPRSGDDAEASPLRDVGVGLGVGLGGILATVVWANLIAVVAVVTVGDAAVSEVGLILLSPPAAALGYGTATVAYLRFVDEDRSFVDVSVPSLRDLGYAIGGLVALFVALQAIGLLFAQFQISTAEHGTVEILRDAAPRVSLTMVALSLLFIGPGEELLFRNVIQKHLYRSFSRRGAIVVGSVVFAAVHFQSYATGTLGQILASLTVVFALSLLLGWLYHRTESVVVPALVHGGYDAILFGSIYVDIAGGPW